MVTPLRSSGGTRRYGNSDVEKLRLLALAVGQGHRIKALSALSATDLQQLVMPKTQKGPLGNGGAFLDAQSAPAPIIKRLFDASVALESNTLNRLLTEQFQLLGGALFAEEIAVPLLRDVGLAWMKGEASIAVEHLVSAQLRRFLGNALTMASAHGKGARILFTTPEGEPHEFGALIAAVVAANAGARVTYLGPDTPSQVVVEAVEQVGATVVALSVVNLDEGSQRRYFRSLEAALPKQIEVWLGGAAACADASDFKLSTLGELRSRVEASIST